MRTWQKMATGILVLGALGLAGLGLVSLWKPLGVRHLYKQQYFLALEIDGGILQVAYARQVGGRLVNRSHARSLGPLGLVSFRMGTNRFDWRYYVLAGPLWTVIALLLVQPTIAFFFGPMRRWLWRRRSRCIGCGYDRLNVPSERCPECGMFFACPACAYDLTQRLVRFCPACGEATKPTRERVG